MSSWVCVDASLVVGLVTHPQRQRLRERWQGWLDSGLQIAAPALLTYEVTNVVHQYVRRSRVSAAAADRLLDMALAMPIRRFAEDSQHRQALVMSRRHGLGATHDGHYLALAESLAADFWTLDRRLVKAVGEAFPGSG